MIEIIMLVLLALTLAGVVALLVLALRRPRSVQADHRSEYQKRAAAREKRRDAIRERAMKERGLK